MKKLTIILFGSALAAASFLNGAGFQLSLTPDIAIQPRTEEINGISIGVWNENPGSQWQLGFVNGATGDSAGFQSFVFLPTFYNYVENYTGVQWAFVNYSSGDFVGWQAAFVNWANGSFVGFQSGALNVVAAEMKGFQWGVVNYCEELNGLQLGLVNWAQRSVSGVQIGLANIIPENQWFSDGDLGPGFIFVNWGF